jgi:small-conductance mechanosensitive channel
MTNFFLTTWDFVQAAINAVPAPVIAAVLLLLAVCTGLALFSLISRLIRRLLAERYPRVFSFLRRTKGVLRFALVLLALTIAARNAPLDGEIAQGLARMFQVGFIVMIGWLAIVAANMVADIYLLRFRVDVEDNLLARKHVTQVRILKRAMQILIVLLTAAAALMTFEVVRQFGISLFASAGLAGIVVGFAARPLLTSLIAGVQIAMTQPIRIDDAVVIEGEWGWIEEITATYVVIKLWDWRRLIVPLSYFMEKPFQNWTREGAAIIGSVFVHTDYTVPVARVREKLEEIAKASKLWDGAVVNLQVTDARQDTVELRALVSARNSPQAWDLRCEVREKLIAFLQQEYPHALPRTRAEVHVEGARALARESVARLQPVASSRDSH